MTLLLLFNGPDITWDVETSFELPDMPDTNFPFLHRLTQRDIDILIMGIHGTGVHTGCAVGGNTTVAMNVSVDEGVVFIEGSRVSVNSGMVTVTEADADNPRIDMIAVNSSGAKVCVQGTASGDPYPAAIPANHAIIAFIYIPPATEIIHDTMIADKRVMLSGIASDNYSILTGNASHTYVPLGSTLYGGFLGKFTPSGTESDFEIIIPQDGQLSRLYVVQSGNGTVAAAVTVTVRVNGADTALVATTTVNAGTYSNTSDIIDVRAGDLVTLKYTEQTSAFDSGTFSAVSVQYNIN